MFNVDIHKAQQILYAWLSNFDKRSYETIRLNCESISKSLGLNLEGRVHWYIFYPLLLSGTVEYAGKDYYALSSSSIIHTGEYTIYVNPSSEITNAIQTKIPGLYISKKDSTIEAIVFDPVSVLKTFPDLESVVNNFHNVVVDLSDAEYYMHRQKKGLTKLR